MRNVRWSTAAAVALLTLGFAPSALAASSAPATAAKAKKKAKVTFTAHGSIDQAYVLNAKKGEKLTLRNRKGKSLASGKADRFGSYIFHDVTPGAGYTVKGKKGVSKSFKVLKAGQNPPASFYKKQPKLKQGLNYVKMRDGVELAMTVRLPAGKKLSDGPFPTVIEYSGYQTAAPHDLLQNVLASLGGKASKPDPLVPETGTAVGAVIGPLLGYASVSVQMRGSGCSGGAFDLFDLPTTYDGYDAVETVAAQKWAKGGKVGMYGISFSGISQLFVAGTRPPHLAAIAPMSVTDDIYSATGYPGGIFNSGFALSWIKDRAQNAQPAPQGGQPWAIALTKAGDKHCIANQKLRLQTMDVLQVIKDNPFRTPAMFDNRSPGAWVSKINVPTFFIGQYQDEQTGGHFPESIAPLSKNPHTWITLQNGVHVDSLGPSTITRWVEFLDLYVADKVPSVPGLIRNLGGELYKFLADAGAAPIKDTRFAGRQVTLAQARAEFDQDPKVRLLMDNGAGPEGLGSIGATWELNYSAWPIPSMAPTDFYLGENGALGAAPTGQSTTSYTGDPSARPIQTLGGSGEGDAWKAQPPYEWTPVAAGKGLGWTTAPLTSDVVIAGTSSLDLYLQSSAKDTDLQVALSEVRPDGAETYVQSGWLRASHRKVDAAKSTANDPVLTQLKQDAADLPSGQFTLVRVPIFPVSHAFRAGSRIRVTLTAPGGDRPRWAFDTLENGSITNTIQLGGATPSKLVLPVIPGADAKGTPLPAPTALRGEPSRTFAPASNGG
jgi:uncharacterized protein